MCRQQIIQREVCVTRVVALRTREGGVPALRQRQRHVLLQPHARAYIVVFAQATARGQVFFCAPYLGN